jgi:hypothetical protein
MEEVSRSTDKTSQIPTNEFTPVSHTVRARSGENITIEGYTRGKAIRLFCTECLGWEITPKECTARLCPLFPYRGKTLASQGSYQEKSVDLPPPPVDKKQSRID